MNKKRLFTALLMAAVFSLSLVPCALAKQVPSDPDIVRVDFVHHKNANAGQKPSGDLLFKLLGYSWGKDATVTYVIDPSGSNLDSSSVIDKIKTAAEAWDAQSNAQVFNDVVAPASGLNHGDLDYVNYINFGTISDSNTIAVTSIWFNRKTHKILDTDMQFNTYYTWSLDATGSTSEMDLQNIATHEFGHIIGLDDLYRDKYIAQTMYGYSREGDIEKRRLESGDIAGLLAIYGM